MKLLEKLRWLPIEIPWPGTADVSGKSWLLAVLVGETPGISSAISRKLRPFDGRLRISLSDTVPAIWLRAASIAPASPVTVTAVSLDAIVSETGSSKAAPAVKVKVRAASANP